MSKYDELVKALRYCYDGKCSECFRKEICKSNILNGSGITEDGGAG